MNACSGSFDTERQTLESGNLGRKPCAVYLLSQLFDDGFRHVINTSQNRRGDLSEVTVEYRNSIRRHTRILDCCTPYTLRRRLRKLKGAYRIVVLRETFGSTIGQQRWLSLIGAIPIVILKTTSIFSLLPPLNETSCSVRPTIVNWSLVIWPPIRALPTSNRRGK